MPLIIDSFNVLHMTGVLPPDLSGMDIEELRGVISLSRFRNQTITLVCDGVQPIELRRQPDDDQQQRALANISMMWSGTETDADTIIEILVAQSSAPRRLTVVTSDRRLTRVIRKRRVRIMTSESFLSRLSRDFRNNVERSSSNRNTLAARPPHAYEVPLHADSVRWWLDYLNIDPDHPVIEGQFIPSSTNSPSDSSSSSTSKEVPVTNQPASTQQNPTTTETDPVRYWLRYFGLNPDQLPEELTSPDDQINNKNPNEIS